MQRSLLSQNLYYPYEWIDGYDKLNHDGLPPKEFFLSSLTKE